MANYPGKLITVLTDKKARIESFTTTGELAYYQSYVISYSDYYPFGMLQPNRNGGGKYRYNFQGQETDDEVKGKGNSVNYKYRMHDPRLGRFFATDPLEASYPYNSPYAFSENVVINAVELEGLEKFDVYDYGHDMNGNSSGDSNFDSENLLYLFSADLQNGDETVEKIDYWKFFNNYQTNYQNDNSSGSQPSSGISGYKGKTYAKVTAVNETSSPEVLRKGIGYISASDFENKFVKPASYHFGEVISPQEFFAFGHGGEYDFKGKDNQYSKYHLLTIVVSEVYSTDYLGNILFGAAMGYRDKYMSSKYGSTEYNFGASGLMEVAEKYALWTNGGPDDPTDNFSILQGYHRGLSSNGYNIMGSNHKFQIGNFSKSVTSDYKFGWGLGDTHIKGSYSYNIYEKGSNNYTKMKLNIRF